MPPVPAGAALVAATLTATDAAPGFVSAYPGSTRPLVSALNLTTANDTRANALLTSFDASGVMHLFSQSGAHLLIDASGYTLP